MTSTTDLPKIVRFFIDTNVCLDQRKCVEEAPNLLRDRPESGGPLIVSDTLNTLEDNLQILNAAWVCPVAAFKIEFEDGSVHDTNGSYIRDLCKQFG